MKLRLTRIAVAVLASMIGSLAVHPIVAQSGAGALAPYTSCRFSDGLQVVQVDSLPPSVHSRDVETDSGTKQVEPEAGVRVMFSYPGTDFYANVKAEQLPAAHYPQLKQILLDSLQHLAPGNTMNTSLNSPINGLEAHGLDRNKLEGGVLGVYLLFDSASHVVTTIYFLNQEPQDRKFQSLDEYRQLREQFLKSYSSCIRKNQQSSQ